MGNLKEAEQLELQMLDMRKKLFGAEHPDSLISMRNLANIYSSQRKWSEAAGLRLQAMFIEKQNSQNFLNTFFNKSSKHTSYQVGVRTEP